MKGKDRHDNSTKNGQPGKNAKSAVQMQRNNNGKRMGGVTGKGFLPGQSGNPGGRPKGSVKISTAYERSLARLVPGDPEGRIYAQFIADKNVELAAQGNIAAIKEVTDRVEGKAPRTVEINHDEFRRNRWSRLVDELCEKYGKPREEVIEDLIEREPSAAEWLM
jgi:Family of unknown function (DUF5681)